MILVTGGTGLVGSHLLYCLSQKHDSILAIYRSHDTIEKVKNVFSFYTKDQKKYFDKIRWLKADILDIPSLEAVFANPITHLYHCAALVSFNPEEYKKMRKTNIEGTANIVNFSVSHQVKKLCYVSSIATIGEAINGQLITEEYEWSDEADNSAYAITKFGGEMEVWRASQEGVEVVIVNPGVILGSGFKEGSGQLFDRIYKGLRFYTTGVTGFVGVKDVVKCMTALMVSNIKNERFILVSENRSFKVIFFKIADAFGKKRPFIKIGKLVAAIFWRLDWLLTWITGKKPLLTKSSARASYNVSRYSSEKIKKSLLIDFQKIDTIIEEVCKYYC